MQRRDDRGAVLPMVSLLLVALIGTAAFAVDLGMQRVARRDMQSLADAVALDAARLLNGRTAAQVRDGSGSKPSLATVLTRSAGRNDDHTLGKTPTVTGVLVDLDANGRVVYVNGSPATVADGSIPDAVLVTATTAVDFGFTGGEGGAQRTALGIAVRTACFSLGSYAARFRSGDSTVIATLVSPMNELVRPQGNLSAADYTGLATANLSVEDLATEAGAGSPESFLTTSITTTRLIQLALAVLGRQSPSNAVAIAALQRIGNGSASLSTPILLTKVLSVTPSDDAAAQADLNVLDLVTGAILVADGTHGFQIGNGNLGAGIAGVASLTSASLNVIESPRMGCGQPGAFAKTSQLSGTAEAKFELPTINLGGGDIVQTSPATVAFTVNVGNATGTLTGEPVCASGTVADPDRLSVAVQSGLSTYTLSTTLGFKTTVNMTGLGNVEITWKQAATSTQSMPDTLTTAALAVPPNDTTPVSTGSGDLGIGGVTVSTTVTDIVATQKSSGASVSSALVTGTVQPLANALAVHATVDGRLDSLAAGIDSALSPLLTLLGLNISGADVYAIGHPDCGSPQLRG